MSEWIMDSSLPLGRNLNLDNTKILHELLKLHSGQWLGQHIIYLLIHRNILELHFSSVHHILDIVISDLNVLQLEVWHDFLVQQEVDEHNTKYS